MFGKLLDLFGSKKLLGLYISPDSVHLAEFQPSITGPQLKNYLQSEITFDDETGEAPLTQRDETKPSAEEDGRDAIRRDRIISTITRLWNESRTDAKNVVCTLPPQEMVVRFFELPAMQKKHLYDAVKYEAQKYIPFNMDDLIYDFEIIESDNERGKVGVIFAAAKKTSVQNLISIVNQAGLKPIAIDPYPFAIIRTIKAKRRESQKNQVEILLVLKGKFANVTIVKDNIPLLVQDIDLPGGSKEVFDQFKNMESLFAELKTFLDYCKKQFSLTKPDRIILTGQEDFSDWETYLKKELGVPVVVRNPFSKDIGIGSFPKLITAGLALKEIIDMPISLNIGKEILFYEAEKVRKSAFSQVPLAIVILVSLFLIMNARVSSLENQVLNLKSEEKRYPILTNEKLDTAALKTMNNEMEKGARVLEIFFNRESFLTTRWGELVNLLPENVWLNSIHYEQRLAKNVAAQKSSVLKISHRMKIEGGAFSKDKSEEIRLANILNRRLKENEIFSSIFKRIDLASMQKRVIESKEITTFTLLCFSEEK